MTFKRWLPTFLASPDAADRTSHASAQAASRWRFFPGWRWMAVWPAFPVAGLIGWTIGGHVDAVAAALVGGALTAAGLAARSGGPPRARSDTRRHGSAPAHSPTPAGWRPELRWSATRPISVRSP